jgi:hypothetical protein
MDTETRRCIGAALLGAVVAVLTADARDDSPLANLLFVFAFLVALGCVAYIGLRLIWPRRRH